MCRVNHWIEKQNRVCFLDNPEQTIFFPVFSTIDNEGNETKPVQVMEQGRFKYIEEQAVTADRIFKWISEMEQLFPQMTSLEIVQTYMKPLCPESLIDPMSYHYFSLESAVSEYGIEALNLPLDLFQAFEVIRSANSQFDNLQTFKAEQEMKSKQK